MVVVCTFKESSIGGLSYFKLVATECELYHTRGIRWIHISAIFGLKTIHNRTSDCYSVLVHFETRTLQILPIFHVDLSYVPPLGTVTNPTQRWTNQSYKMFPV